MFTEMNFIKYRDCSEFETLIDSSLKWNFRNFFFANGSEYQMPSQSKQNNVSEIEREQISLSGAAHHWFRVRIRIEKHERKSKRPLNIFMNLLCMKR